MKSKTKAPSNSSKARPQHKLTVPLAMRTAEATGASAVRLRQQIARPERRRPPITRKKFDGAWDELKYLYQKILYWCYHREDRRRASEFGNRFEELLKRLAAENPESIFLAECWSIFYELNENLERAIEHRAREIELILRLWKVSENSPARAYALDGYGIDALCDRFELLSIFYHDAGKLDRAIVHLVESQRLCESAKIPFEGRDLLEDYLDEREPSLAIVLGAESSSRN